jgi:predicted metal-dependent phosphoesterase TrpH
LKFDFHLHTTMSDGRVTPEALVFKASARDLDVIAVTDHDTTAGIEAATSEADYYGVKIVPGSEVSADVPLDEGQGERARVSVHLIALAVTPGHEAFERMLLSIREGRERATRETVERLALAGYPIDLEKLGPGLPGSSRCRPHIADALVAAGHARSRQDAFELYLGGDAYRSHYELPTAEEAIRAIHAAGGLAVYAHPNPDEIDTVTPALKDAGLVGIEVFRGARPSSVRGLYAEEIARRHGLLASGGSDWHGVGGRHLGDFWVTEEQIGPLAKAVLERV